MFNVDCIAGKFGEPVYAFTTQTFPIMLSTVYLVRFLIWRIGDLQLPNLKPPNIAVLQYVYALGIGRRQI